MAGGADVRAWHGLVWRSAVMGRAVDRAMSCATSPHPLLITGESGTGKELLAEAVHAASRRPGALVALNCAAIPPGLLEAELFGTEAGAFTGAVRRVGLIEQANGGTLFLDEIGELSAAGQASLLRALDGRAIRRVGGVHEFRSSFRLLAATHRDLEHAAAKGGFREDLYFRVMVLGVRLPALRERREDIGPIAAALLPSHRLSPEALSALEAASWAPGNVRALRNALYRAAVASDWRSGDGVILSADLDVLPPDPARDALLLEQLDGCGGSVRALARVLGQPRSTVKDRVARVRRAASGGGRPSPHGRPSTLVEDEGSGVGRDKPVSAHVHGL